MSVRTFIFADVVGSSTLKGHRHFGPDKRSRNEHYFRDVNRPHLERLRICVAAHNGQFIKDVGDSVFAAFDSPTDGVRCAIEMQRSLRDDPITTLPGDRLHIRIGLHSGEAVEYEKDFHGLVVDKAARTEHAAGADDVVITESTRQLCGDFGDVPFHRIGEFDLRGVGRTVLTEVDWAGIGPRLTNEGECDANRPYQRIQEAQRQSAKPQRVQQHMKVWLSLLLAFICAVAIAASRFHPSATPASPATSAQRKIMLRVDRNEVGKMNFHVIYPDGRRADVMMEPIDTETSFEISM